MSKVIRLATQPNGASPAALGLRERLTTHASMVARIAVLASARRVAQATQVELDKHARDAAAQAMLARFRMLYPAAVAPKARAAEDDN